MANQWRRFRRVISLLHDIFGMTKGLIIGMLYGWTFPVTNDQTAHTISSLLAIVIWGVMMYWRLPGKLWRIVTRKSN